MALANSIPPHVGGCLKPALVHAQAGRLAQGIECVAAAAVADIQQHQQVFLSDAANAAILCDLYAQLFAGAGIKPVKHHPARTPGGRVRLLYVVSSLVEGQAASANIARFCTLHDAARFECRVLCVEEFTRRSPALTFLDYPDAPSSRIGAGVIASLPPGACTVLEPIGDLLAGAHGAIGAARALSPDVAVFVASPACPIQAACAFARVAPRQVNMNIGVPLPIAGIDEIVYNNPRRWHQDRAFLASCGIDSRSVETSGGDARAGVHTTPRARAALGLPADAFALVTAGNRLPQRLAAGTFIRDLALFLDSHPRAWWVGVGPGDFSPIRAALSGAASRVVTPGPAPDIRPIVKACDVYVNEYPEGGGNTVIEAMGCGTPVVALYAGPRHAQHIGASLAGEEITDVAAYWRRVGVLAGDAPARRALGQAQQARALEKFDYPVIARAYEASFTPA